MRHQRDDRNLFGLALLRTIRPMSAGAAGLTAESSTGRKETKVRSHRLVRQNSGYVGSRGTRRRSSLRGAQVRLVKLTGGFWGVSSKPAISILPLPSPSIAMKTTYESGEGEWR